MKCTSNRMYNLKGVTPCLLRFHSIYFSWHNFLMLFGGLLFFPPLNLKVVVVLQYKQSCSVKRRWGTRLFWKSCTDIYVLSSVRKIVITLIMFYKVAWNKKELKVLSWTLSTSISVLLEGIGSWGMWWKLEETKT